MNRHEHAKYNADYHEVELGVLQDTFSQLEAQHDQQPGGLLLTYAVHVYWKPLVQQVESRFNLKMDMRSDPYRASKEFIELELNNFLETLADCARKLGTPESQDLLRYLFTRDCPPKFIGKSDAGAIMRKNGATRLQWIYQDNRLALPVHEGAIAPLPNFQKILFPNT